MFADLFRNAGGRLLLNRSEPVNVAAFLRAKISVALIAYPAVVVEIAINLPRFGVEDRIQRVRPLGLEKAIQGPITNDAFLG